MKILDRQRHRTSVERLLREFPVVAILGARQVGKTTLARQVVERRRGPTTFFDLEDPRDRAQLADPMLALEALRGLVVLDEIQHCPELFATLRVLADRPRKPARFLVLGSASPKLLRQGSESLAGRISFHELRGFDLEEVGSDRFERLWLRGGFPASFLASSQRQSEEWRRSFIRTFTERDLPSLGILIPGHTLGRFWAMLAHYHGQTWNASEFARSFGMSHTAIRRYLDTLANTFVVRLLPPWAENIGKRTVKSPKLYLADSGILHTQLGVETRRDLHRHPKIGASWEGFLLEEVIRHLRARRDECWFWGTHAGAEIDLLVVRGQRRTGFELKRTTTPKVTASMRSATETLRLRKLYLVHAGKTSFPLTSRIRAVAAHELLREIGPRSI